MRKSIGGMRGGPRKLVYSETGIGSGEMYFTDACISYAPGEIDCNSELLSVMEL